MLYDKQLYIVKTTGTQTIASEVKNVKKQTMKAMCR